jgi:hypothetical protein
VYDRLFRKMLACGEFRFVRSTFGITSPLGPGDAVAGIVVAAADGEVVSGVPYPWFPVHPAVTATTAIMARRITD